MGDFARAGADFDHSLQLDPGHAYAVLWRRLADRRGAAADPAALAHQETAVDQSRWPGPMVGYYLGRVPEADVVAAAARAQAQDSLSESCEASFYLAEDRLTKGDAAQARPLLQATVKTCPPAFFEAAAARAELKRLDRAP
jgi:lipoprotein NlpI